MKKIETIVENCKDCRFCQRFYRIAADKESAFICKKTERVIEMGNNIDPDLVYKPSILPDWCPLETYNEAYKSEALPTSAVITPSTIILPGMPHLEWMTENLSGYGGTEVNGRTYYTYDEAVAAVEQLGNGWRIPTRGEMVDLYGLGSVWQEEGPQGLPGRLFGGGLFLEAAGFRSATSEALADVGTSGRYWSYSSGVAGNMGFGSYYIYPLFDMLAPSRLSVRCVRNVK